eukprot:g12430.t1
MVAFVRVKLFTSLLLLTAVTAADLEQTLLKDINSGSGSSLGFNSLCIGSFDGKVYFTADDGNGNALWKTDGTSGGTTKVRDGYACWFTALGNKMIYTGTTTSYGSELHVMQNNGQVWLEAVKDFKTGTPSGNPKEYVNVGSNLIFSAVTVAEGWELWKTDGTGSGTVIVKDIVSGDSSAPQNLVSKIAQYVCDSIRIKSISIHPK